MDGYKSDLGGIGGWEGEANPVRRKKVADLAADPPEDLIGEPFRPAARAQVTPSRRCFSAPFLLPLCEYRFSVNRSQDYEN